MNKIYTVFFLLLFSVISCGEPAIVDRTYICNTSDECPPNQWCVNYFAVSFINGDMSTYPDPVVASINLLGLTPENYYHGICWLKENIGLGPDKIAVEVCDNNRDDDGDGRIDCDDPTCLNHYSKACISQGFESRDSCSIHDTSSNEAYVYNQAFEHMDDGEYCLPLKLPGNGEDLWIPETGEFLYPGDHYIMNSDGITVFFNEYTDKKPFLMCGPGCKIAIYSPIIGKPGYSISYDTCNGTELDSWEWCDSLTIRPGIKCTSFGYNSGNLKCGDDCSLDFSSCEDYSSDNEGACNANDTFRCSEINSGEPPLWAMECVEQNPGEYIWKPVKNCGLFPENEFCIKSCGSTISQCNNGDFRCGNPTNGENPNHVFICDENNMWVDTTDCLVTQEETGCEACAPPCDTSTYMTCGFDYDLTVPGGVYTCTQVDSGSSVWVFNTDCNSNPDFEFCLNNNNCQTTFSDCGNNLREGEEECDGTDVIANLPCSSLGNEFSAGSSSSCTASCTYDRAQCFTNSCNNGTLEVNEWCENSVENGLNCGMFLGGLTSAWQTAPVSCMCTSDGYALPDLEGSCPEPGADLPLCDNVFEPFCSNEDGTGIQPEGFVMNCSIYDNTGFRYLEISQRCENGNVCMTGEGCIPYR
ncbi:MAG: hypothetical protein JXR95_10425 [Deltaproteobacteria bacterium]|nr:hypothetical protein [Deltaproteobacteria bacterium]